MKKPINMVGLGYGAFVSESDTLFVSSLLLAKRRRDLLGAIERAQARIDEGTYDPALVDLLSEAREALRRCF